VLFTTNLLWKQEDAFPKIQVRQPKKVADTIKGVVTYLKGLKEDGKTLSKVRHSHTHSKSVGKTAQYCTVLSLGCHGGACIHVLKPSFSGNFCSPRLPSWQAQRSEARKWYLQTTAVVLGRYAYEDREAALEKNAAGLDDLKPRAEKVKQAMDEVDAKAHLERMGADAWMKGDKGMSVVQQLTQTERLARFLSEIENAMHEKKAAFVEASPHQPSSNQKLKAHEHEIVRTINRLLGAVKNGDPVTGAATNLADEASKTDTSTQKHLMHKLMKSVDRENKASILTAAGEVAQKKIDGAIHSIHKKVAGHAQVKQAKPRVLPTAVIVKKNDVVAPLGTLHKMVVKQVSHALSFISRLFEKRKAARTRMSVKDYKQVNRHLQGVAAHLMERYAKRGELQPFVLKVPLQTALTMPLAKAAWMRKQSSIDREARDAKAFKQAHGRNPIHVGLTLPLKQAREALKPTGLERNPIHDALKMPLKLARKALKLHKPTLKLKKKAAAKSVAPKARDPVSQFVWHTLKQKEIHRDQKATSLAGLLENGVKLRQGFLRFATPQ